MLFEGMMEQGSYGKTFSRTADCSLCRRLLGPCLSCSLETTMCVSLSPNFPVIIPTVHLVYCRKNLQNKRERYFQNSSKQSCRSCYSRRGNFPTCSTSELWFLCTGHPQRLCRCNSRSYQGWFYVETRSTSGLIPLHLIRCPCSLSLEFRWGWSRYHPTRRRKRCLCRI